MRRSAAPSPMAAIFRLQVRGIAGGFRFQAISFLLVAVMALAALIAGSRYHRELLGRSRMLESYGRSLAGVDIDRAAEVLHPAVKPPWVLSLAVDGGQALTPDVLARAPSPQVSPEVRYTHSGNYRLPGRESLDWTFALGVLLPLAAILLGYDLVCGERRSGALKLLLSYPVAGWKVLAGKGLALWACLALPLVAGALLSALLARGPGGVPLGAGEVAKLCLIVLVGLWAAAFYSLVTLLVSVVSRAPSDSLSVLVWLWVTGVFVLPALSGLLAHALLPIPAEGEVRSRLQEIDRRISRELGASEGRWRGAELARVDGYAWERRSALVENRRAALHEEVRRSLWRRKVDQARLAALLASASPVSLVENALERVAGSGVGRDESFLAQARAFHASLARRLRDLDTADPESPHLLFFAGYLSRRPIDPRALPRFAFRERSLPQGLAAARWQLALFAFETIAVAAATFYAFVHAEPG